MSVTRRPVKESARNATIRGKIISISNGYASVALSNNGAVITGVPIIGSAEAGSNILLEYINGQPIGYSNVQSSATQSSMDRSGTIGIPESPAPPNQIAGWIIEVDRIISDSGLMDISANGKISAGSGNNIVVLDTTDPSYYLYAGHSTSGSAPFSVTKTGDMKATAGSIASWVILQNRLESADASAKITSGSAPYISLGAAGYLSGSGMWVGRDSGTYKMFLGNYSTNRYMAWDGTNLSVRGSITADSGALYDLSILGTLTTSGSASVGSSNYSAGMSGWKILGDGTAEFANVSVRGEIRTAVFTYQEVQAFSGTFGVFKSAGVLRADVTIPTSGSFGIDVDDPPYTHARQFANSDILRIKTGTNDTWLLVNSGTDMTTFWRYSVTRQSGSSNVTYLAGQAIVDYGQANQGWIYMTADETNNPFMSVRTHTGSPWSSMVEHLRIGNLNGNWNYGSAKYGIAIGEYASGKPNITIDNDGIMRFRIHSTDVMKFENGNADLTGKLRLPGTTSAITSGSAPPTASNAGTGIWMDRTGLYALSSGSYQVKIDALDGKLYAGNGNVILDSTGLSLVPSLIDVHGFEWQNSIRWIGPNTSAQLSAGYNWLANSHCQMYLWANSAVQNGGSAMVRIESGAPMPGTEYAGVSVEIQQQNSYNGYGKVFMWGGYTSLTVEGSGSAGGNNKITGTGDLYLPDKSIRQSTAISVRAYHDANQALSVSGTIYAMALNSERYDDVPSGVTEMHNVSTNNSRLTCRVAGVYQISGDANIASNNTGYRMIGIRLNGSTLIATHRAPAVQGSTHLMSISTQYKLAVNDYVELVAQQTSGGSLDVLSENNHSPEFMMTRLA